VSHLGDRLVEHGPYKQDFLIGVGFSSDLRWVRAADLNALRDELIDLRAAAAPSPQECQEETWSGDHFTPEQADGYWIVCDLRGPHDEHKDEHTGLTWKAAG
jgi:hypothetical protein